METPNKMIARQPRYLQYFKTGFFESSSSTKLQNTKFRHNWSIHDFSDYCDLKGTKISSSIFSDGTANGLKWRLEINSIVCRNEIYGHNNYLDVDLFLVSKNIDNFEANCQLRVLNGKLEQKNHVKKKVQFTMSNLTEKFSQFIYKPEFLYPKYQYLVDDKLTIQCEIVIFGSVKNTSSQFAMPNDLGLLLFENPDYTVITFSVSGRNLYALKKILVANSPVFAAMFNHDTKENKINLIDIKDASYEVMEKMLRYLYTNEISNLKEMADRLLFVADKYELEDLKQRCEVSMSKNLTIANAAQYYMVANRHNAEELKSQIQNFIMTNPHDVQRSAGFKSCYALHARLFNALGLRISQ